MMNPHLIFLADGINMVMSSKIDVRVNNAAITCFGVAEVSSPDVFRRIFETNFTGITYLYGKRVRALCVMRLMLLLREPMKSY